jgi:hypothetical protein
MIHDIFVNLSVRKNAKTGGSYAVSVASTLEAHITGIAMAFVPDIPGESVGYLKRDNETAAQNAIDRFMNATGRAGVFAEARMLRTGFATAADKFGRIARRSDLAIVDQFESDGSSVEGKIPESTLFESGRPVIVVPYIQKTPLELNRIVVCWDGSRPAVHLLT